MYIYIHTYVIYIYISLYIKVYIYFVLKDIGMPIRIELWENYKMKTSILKLCFLALCNLTLAYNKNSFCDAHTNPS